MSLSALDDGLKSRKESHTSWESQLVRRDETNDADPDVETSLNPLECVLDGDGHGGGRRSSDDSAGDGYRRELGAIVAAALGDSPCCCGGDVGGCGIGERPAD